MADEAIGKDRGVELEAKRRADGSWHPCQVSLRPGGLSVKLEGEDSEDIILDVDNALTCLRVRSVPLYQDDCCYIEEGTEVLAAREQNSDRLFFDAVVQKVELIPRMFLERYLSLGSIVCVWVLPFESSYK
uniref:SAWADEE domain-containing protein n=1 Tax=Opuntia streptacantha TaxID=393608 RepID=A0A7C9ELG2_OPUST